MSDAERKPDEYPDLNVGAYMNTQTKVPLFSWKQEGSHIEPVEGLYKKPTETKVSWAMIMNAMGPLDNAAEKGREREPKSWKC